MAKVLSILSVRDLPYARRSNSILLIIFFNFSLEGLAIFT